MKEVMCAVDEMHYICMSGIPPPIPIAMEFADCKLSLVRTTKKDSQTGGSQARTEGLARCPC